MNAQFPSEVSQVLVALAQPENELVTNKNLRYDDGVAVVLSSVGKSIYFSSRNRRLYIGQMAYGLSFVPRQTVDLAYRYAKLFIGDDFHFPAYDDLV